MPRRLVYSWEGHIPLYSSDQSQSQGQPTVKDGEVDLTPCCVGLQGHTVKDTRRGGELSPIQGSARTLCPCSEMVLLCRTQLGSH